MNQTTTTSPAQHAALARMQQFMSASPVPSISTELLAMADGELNRELHHFLFDAPSDPHLLEGKRIAICCTNGVEEVEILGSMRWLREHGATVHVVAPRIGPFPDSLGLRFPPIAETHVLCIRLMENAGWLRIDTYLEDAKVATQDALDKTRKAAATTALVGALSLLIGAFISSASAALGGRQRDEEEDLVATRY